MPLSEKRLAANRANAAKSTGPKTPAGKRNSSLNGTRHGLLADAILIDNESRERFGSLINALTAEFQPETASEHNLIERMAVAHWRLLRLWTMESAAIVHETRRQAEAHGDENPATRALLAVRAIANDTRHLDLMSRYEHRFDLQYHRALEAMRRAKANRVAEAAGAIQSHQPDENKGPVE